MRLPFTARTVLLPVMLLFVSSLRAPAGTVTFERLLDEMANYDALARFPARRYLSLQATSYNRESVRRGEPGWFADSDGTGFIRSEQVDGKTEWVIMEHEGPGCLTRFWTPFFYYDFDERTGPNVKIYLDGSDQAAISTPLIHLVTEKSFVRPPFSTFTARGGVCYLPVPFARSAKVTLDRKPFYYAINYRAYPPGTEVRTFTMADYKASEGTRETVGRAMVHPVATTGAPSKTAGPLPAGGSIALRHAAHGGSIRELTVTLDSATIARKPHLLRAVVLAITFDGEQTVWSPVGDFFSSANAINPFETWTRGVTKAGVMRCRWVMPFSDNAIVELLNLGDTPVEASLSATVGPWRWDERSMHFHANWRSDDVLPGDRFADWNFIDITGKGVLVGDAFTVLSPGRGWWGEGDEKIYVDDACEKGFPTHFGTGTEDYYGWAGGRVPTRRDIFSTPFAANISVGSTSEDNPRGFNICSRSRALDAVPFDRRLVFDMEASPGTDIRNHWNLLGYSAVVYWYGRPGASSNRPPLPKAVRVPIMSLDNLDRRQEELRRGH